MASANRVTRPTRATTIPRLRHGDHLTRSEFRRRYEAMPEVKKAELLDGVVFMPSPTRHEDHGSPNAALVAWLTVYAAYTPGTEPGSNSTVRITRKREESEPQPDGLLRLLQEHGGQTRIDEEGYLVGGPELAAEVAASSVNYDLHEKFAVYQRIGVREYVVWRVEDQVIDWFVLRDTKYGRLKPGSDGVFRSKVFPGLWLDARALLHGEFARVLKVLQEGLVSREHQVFVDKLQGRKK